MPRRVEKVPKARERSIFLLARTAKQAIWVGLSRECPMNMGQPDGNIMAEVNLTGTTSLFRIIADVMLTHGWDRLAREP